MMSAFAAGGWAKVDIQKIASHRPDLVLAFGGLQVPLVDKLDQLGVTTFCFCPKTVAETLHMLEIVGQITGKGEKAATLVKKARCSAGQQSHFLTINFS